MISPVARGAAVLAAAALLVTSCSNQKASINRRPTTGATTAAAVDGIQDVRVTAGDTYRFNPSTITVHPGKVRITLVHTGTGAPHDFQVLGFPLDLVPLTSAGQTNSVTFTTPSPGTYTFVCTIHEAQGQTGKLVVLPN